MHYVTRLISSGQQSRRVYCTVIATLILQGMIYFSPVTTNAWGTMLLEPHEGPLPARIQGAQPEPSVVFPTVQLLLDSRTSDQQRADAIEQHAELAPDLLTAIVSDLIENEEAEIASRIPSMWRVAVATGNRNDADQIERVLDVALPADESELKPWQAVVVGGGIINGLSQQGISPADRVEEILADDSFVKSRWDRAIRQAAKIAEDESFAAGTRYDALRIVGMQDWQQSQHVLVPLLSSDTPAELQMGAVAAVVDARNPDADEVLIKSLGGLSERNRQLAISGLLRTNRRAGLLLKALGNGEVQSRWISDEQLNRLRGMTSNRSATAASASTRAPRVSRPGRRIGRLRLIVR